MAKTVFGFEGAQRLLRLGRARRRHVRRREAGARFEEALAKYEPGECETVLAGPLARIGYEPETVVVYGTRRRCCGS
jgi:uncharacterized protein (DUF169 family)